jgi:hypothetical protein
MHGGALVDVDMLVAAGRELPDTTDHVIPDYERTGTGKSMRDYFDQHATAEPTPLACLAAIGAAVAEQQRRAAVDRSLYREIIDSMIRGLSGPHAKGTAAVLMAAVERANLTPVEARATIAACEAWERRRGEVAPVGPWGEVAVLDPVQRGCCAGESSEAAWKALGAVRWFPGLDALREFYERARI